MSATLTTTDTTTEVQPTATLVVRVPRGTDGGLAAGAEKQLATLTHVTSVNVDQMCGIEPRGGATYVTVDATFTMDFDALPDDTPAEVRNALTDSVAVDSIKALSAPQPTPAPTE
jgi:hypothetical protein